MRFIRLLPVLILAIAMGCQSDNQMPQHKAEATKRWNDARSGVLLSLARDQYTGGALEKSRQTLNDALRLSPDNASARILSARLYLEAGQLESADAELKLARKLDPQNAEADYLGGIVYQRWEQPKQALDCYQNACDKAPTELAYALAKAEMLVALNRSPEALSFLQEKIGTFEHSGVIRDAVGMLLIQQGQFDDGAEMLRRASILASDDLPIREHLGVALYYAGRYQESQDVLSRLITDDRYAKRGDLLMTLAECQLQTGHAGDARGNFQIATEMAPASPVAWRGLAKCALQLGDLARAEIALNKSLRLDPTGGETYLLMGYLRLRQSRNQDALAAFTRASGLDPKDTVSICMIGYTLEKLSQPNAALGYYTRALQLRPHDELATELMTRLDAR